jgi:hypothetical protein
MLQGRLRLDDRILATTKNHMTLPKLGRYIDEHLHSAFARSSDASEEWVGGRAQSYKRGAQG